MLPTHLSRRNRRPARFSGEACEGIILLGCVGPVRGKKRWKTQSNNPWTLRTCELQSGADLGKDPVAFKRWKKPFLFLAGGGRVGDTSRQKKGVESGISTPIAVCQAPKVGDPLAFRSPGTLALMQTPRCPIFILGDAFFALPLQRMCEPQTAMVPTNGATATI